MVGQVDERTILGGTRQMRRSEFSAKLEKAHPLASRRYGELNPQHSDAQELSGIRAVKNAGYQ